MSATCGRALLAALIVGAMAGPRAAYAAETPIQFFLAQAAAPAPIQPAGRAPRRLAIFRARPAETLRQVAGSPVVPNLVAEAAHWLGQGNPTGKPGAWCAWFVSFVLERTGHRPLASGMAASALAYGPRLPGPRVGALAVLARRGRITHVGLVAAVHGDSVELISGNWSHRVARAVLPTRAFAAFIGV